MILWSGVFLACSKTTVVLLDSGKSHNEILVGNEKGERLLSEVGSYVDLVDKNETISKVEIMPKDEIESRFSKVIANEPLKAISYILYFKVKSMDLIPESQDALKKALKSIKERSPCTIDIIGHTDTTGSSALNIKVSLKRAKHIAALLKKENSTISGIVAKGYGEEDLLVLTDDNIDEARNRNVEIYIK
jgi:outer membrane protein OmpA-like peptidoglycan-associated protein